MSGVVVETTNPEEALFCTVKIINADTLHCAMVSISNTGAVSFTSEDLQSINIKKSFVLAKDYNETAGTTIFTNGSIYLDIPSSLSSGKLHLNGILSASSDTDSASFDISNTDNNNIAYSDLEVHYFAVKSSNSEDSGGDSPIID